MNPRSGTVSTRCAFHPDRDVDAVFSDGVSRCAECAAPWHVLLVRQSRELAELLARHARECEDLRYRERHKP